MATKTQVAKANAFMEEAEAAAVEWKLDQDFEESFLPEPTDGPIDDPIKAQEALEKEQAERRRAYLAAFRVESRRHAAWYARKWIETKQRIERQKRARDAEIQRLQRKLDLLREVQPALIEWAKQQERDTKTSIRLPEAGARVQFYDKKAAADVADEADLLSWITETMGEFQALDRGLVESKIRLKVSAVKEYLEQHAMPDEALGAFVYPDTGETVPGVVYQPAHEAVKIVTVQKRKKGEQP